MGRAAPHSPSSPRPFFTKLLCAFMLLWCLTPLPVVAQTEQEQSRSCWGFLYCKETKGDTTWTEGFLWLYSTEERGTFSRLTLIPFYSREMDPATHYVRRSLLWPVAIAEHKGEDSYVQLLPFYWQAQDPARHYTVFAPLYFDYAAGDARYTHVIPLYGHHQRGSLFHRYYLLGPLAIATYNKETDLKEWDVLFPLFHYGADRKGYEARVFPLYWAGETYGDGRWYRHLLPLYWSGGHEADGSWYRHILPLYGRSVTPQSDLSYVFPLYGSVTDAQSHETRTALVGLPPLPQTSLPTLALYEHASAPTSVSDRVFPLYRYAYAEPEQLTELTMMALFQMKTSPTLTAHRLFPLYSYEDDREKNQGGWSFLGYDRFALTGYGHDPAQQWHQFLPLYRASEAPAAQTETVDALGLGPLSLFRHVRHPDGSSHRLFPLYNYDHPATEEWHWSALIAAPLALYRHDEQGTAIHDRFLPLYDWDRHGESREFSMLGVSWFAMFYQESSPTRISHRLFPLYRYRHVLASDDMAMDTLLLHRHHSTATHGTDRFLFLWDSTWQREQPVWELDVLGIKPLTLFHHAASSTDTADRLFPLYGYARSAAEETRLSILGFPPPENAFSWSLYEQRRAPQHVLTRLFPLYRYERNDETKDVNWSALLLYRHTESETHLLDTFLPIHEYERDSATGTAAFNLIGLKPITLFKQSSAPDAANSMLFPLYDYDRQGDTNRLSLLGWPKIGTFPTLSLFERVATPSETTASSRSIGTIGTTTPRPSIGMRSCGGIAKQNTGHRMSCIRSWIWSMTGKRISTKSESSACDPSPSFNTTPLPTSPGNTRPCSTAIARKEPIDASPLSGFRTSGSFRPCRSWPWNAPPPRTVSASSRSMPMPKTTKMEEASDASPHWDSRISARFRHSPSWPWSRPRHLMRIASFRFTRTPRTPKPARSTGRRCCSGGITPIPRRSRIRIFRWGASGE